MAAEDYSTGDNETILLRKMVRNTYVAALNSIGGDPPVNVTPPSIETDTTKEVTTILCPGQSSGSADTSGFDIDSADGVKTVRINDAADVSVTIGPDATETEVAQAIKAEMESVFPTLWSISESFGILVITDNFVGARTPAVEVGGPFNFNITSSQLEVIQVGSTLTRTEGTWTGADTITGNWQHDQGTGTWVDIAGETGATYVVQVTDAGQNIRYNETATNGAGSTSEPSNELGPVEGATYLRPDGVSTYFRPDGISIYLQP